MKTFRIQTASWTAGLKVLEPDMKVIFAAPILKWAIGKRWESVRATLELRYKPIQIEEIP